MAVTPYRGGNDAASSGGPPVFNPGAISVQQGPMLVLDHGTGNPFAGSPLGSKYVDGVSAPQNSPTVVDLDGGVAHWFSLSPGERESFAERAYKAGLIADPNDYSQAQSAWNAAVQQAAGFRTYGNRDVTPWEAIDIMAGVTPGGGRKSLAGTKTSTEKVVDLPTKTTMRAGIRAIMSQELGRAPTADEIDRYSEMFTKAARESPSTVKTTTTYDDSGRVTNQNSTRSGGFTGTDMQELATEKAQSSNEWGSYQAATTYFNALMGAIGEMG